MSPPTGALSRKEAELLGRSAGNVIYKCSTPHYGNNFVKVVTTGKQSWDSICVTNEIDNIWLSVWFREGTNSTSMGYLFTNYFYALAYRLRQKELKQ